MSIIFADITEQVGRTVINALAVAGSAALGYGLTYVLIWTICRLTIHAQPPTSLRKILSVLGAIAMGVLAATLLFNSGGLGFGLGGGLGFGTGNSTRPETSAKNNSTVQPTQPKAPPTNPDQSRSAPPLRVKVLGGKIPSKKFYIVEPDTDARNIDSLKTLINDRSVENPGPHPTRELIIVLRDGDSAGYDSSAVKELDETAKRFGLSVGYDPPETPK